jgi:hypothetical protein
MLLLCLPSLDAPYHNPMRQRGICLADPKKPHGRDAGPTDEKRDTFFSSVGPVSHPWESLLSAVYVHRLATIATEKSFTELPGERVMMFLADRACSKIVGW